MPKKQSSKRTPPKKPVPAEPVASTDADHEHSFLWLFLDSLEVLIDDAIRCPGNWLDHTEEAETRSRPA